MEHYINWKQLLNISIKEWALNVQLGPILLILFFLFFIYFLIQSLRKFCHKNFEVVEANLSMANIGNVTIRPNHEVMRIAYQAWVELKTRKAALLFDEEHDLIFDIYKSWYELFKVLRELTKSVPAHRVRVCKDTNELIDIMIEVLNKGLRPHLTRWHARFNNWYKSEENCHPKKSPQEIQQLFPEYQALVNDLKIVNQGLIEYASWLNRIVVGEKRK